MLSQLSKYLDSYNISSAVRKLLALAEILTYPLPFCYPTVLGTHHGNHAVEIETALRHTFRKPPNQYLSFMAKLWYNKKFTRQKTNLCIHKPSPGFLSSEGKTHSCRSRHIQTGQWSKVEKKKITRLYKSRAVKCDEMFDDCKHEVL